jgi:hypothetical protein
MVINTAKVFIHQPSPFEIETAAEKLKMYTLPGTDQIPTEVIQAGDEALHSKMHDLTNTIWNKEEFHHQWKKYISIPTYKKGNKY